MLEDQDMHLLMCKLYLTPAGYSASLWRLPSPWRISQFCHSPPSAIMETPTEKVLGYMPTGNAEHLPFWFVKFTMMLCMETTMDSKVSWMYRMLLLTSDEFCACRQAMATNDKRAEFWDKRWNNKEDICWNFAHLSVTWTTSLWSQVITFERENTCLHFLWYSWYSSYRYNQLLNSICMVNIFSFI